jgi:uncharacterized protein (TIGR02453 family)
MAITPALFDFLRELRENDNRPWFEANRARFEADVRDALIGFVVDFSSHLHEISARYLADPRPVGGSIFRIFRDTRFARDKTPYKTNAGVHFRHDAGKDVHAPGFYLHLAPGEVFAGFGIWHPDPATQGKIRDAIVARPDEWRRVTAGLSLMGDRLARPPRGYDPAHPLIDDLRRKDFVATVRLSEAEACRPDFVERYAATCHAAAPLMRFLTEAVGLPW